jgi:hypothetical protein
MTRRLRRGGALVLLLAAGCAFGPKDRVEIEERFTLGDGEGRAVPLEPGSYRLELASEGEEVSVEWIGSDCPRTEHTAMLTTSCRLFKEGQLQVRNPTEFGAHGEARVTFKVIHLGRDL